MNYLYFAASVLCLIGIGVLTIMGMSHIIVGAGLHPYAAAFGIGFFGVCGFVACSRIEVQV